MKRCRNYCLVLALAIIPSFAHAWARTGAQSGTSDPQRPVAPPPAPQPHVIGNPGVWFGPAAYPAAAIRAGEQGRTIATLQVDPSGTPVHCEVTTSSASAALDTATCEIALAHLRFTLAYDKSGAAKSFIYVLPVRWVLPESVPAARVSFSVLSRAEITRSGIVLSCVKKIEGSDPSDAAGDDCGDLRDDPGTAAMFKAPLAGQHAILWIQSALTFDGDRPFRDDYKAAGRFAVGYTRVHFEIAPDGSIIGCEKMTQAGLLAAVDLCDHFIERFAPRAGYDRRGATFLFAASAAPADVARSARRGASHAR